MNLSQKLLKLLTLLLQNSLTLEVKKKNCLITTQVIGVDWLL
jgi:hypothetical protein